jgi:hypothetical protein
LAVLNQLTQNLTVSSQLALGNASRLTELLDKQLLSGWSDFIVMLAHYGPALKEATEIRHACSQRPHTAGPTGRNWW